ncbi:MAG: hypothetical protein HQK89_02245, partial [Nitrospirae bacterium]|nr:hypothetical protein [Nitrospirota bacterium]
MKPKKDISKEPEMANLKDTFKKMSEGEQGRTIDYLNAKGGDNVKNENDGQIINPIG